MNDITIYIENDDKSITTLSAPVDMGLSLMEFLKGNDYDIQATCGGMALCATCHIEVLEGFDKLPEPGSDEVTMLDTLPDIRATSRLSCQLRLSNEMDNIKLRVIGGE